MDKIVKRVRGNHIIAVSIGIVYVWFGGLKFFEGLSPAEELATKTIQTLSGGIFSSSGAMLTLAVIEMLIGVLLLLNFRRKVVVVAALTHLFFTFTPLFLFANESFNEVPYALTLTGQYIIKNLVIVAALVTLYRNDVQVSA